MALRTLYLQRMLSINGRDALAGRVLYDRFHVISEETLLGHIVCDDKLVDSQRDSRIKHDLISRSLLREFQANVVYLEGGLFISNEGEWRFPEDEATNFCEDGRTLIVSDVDLNELIVKKEQYFKTAKFFGASARYGNVNDREPVYGADENRYWRGFRQILCNPDKMVIDEWLRPIYDGVPEILVGIPGCLSQYGSLVASCNSDTTGILDLDRWIDRVNACPFASAAQIGSGFAVFIAGNVSGDVWLEGCKHNTTWLTNLAAFLVDAAASDRSRRQSYRRSPHLLFLSHRSIDKPTVSAIARQIKNEGVNVWLDEDRLVPSQSLPAEISSALDKMTHFVLFWSSNCVGAAWVERELNSAIALLIERSIPLIIVRLDQTPVPSILADLYRIESLDLTSEATGVRIADAVARLGGSTRG
jgi:hypothetical protein